MALISPVDSRRQLRLSGRALSSRSRSLRRSTMRCEHHSIGMPALSTASMSREMRRSQFRDGRPCRGLALRISGRGLLGGGQGLGGHDLRQPGVELGHDRILAHVDCQRVLHIRRQRALGAQRAAVEYPRRIARGARRPSLALELAAEERAVQQATQHAGLVSMPWQLVSTRPRSAGYLSLQARTYLMADGTEREWDVFGRRAPSPSWQ